VQTLAEGQVPACVAAMQVERMPRTSGMIAGTHDAAGSRTALAGGPDGRTLDQ
jgi:hypothetical protein